MSRVSIIAKNVIESRLYFILRDIVYVGALISLFFQNRLALGCCVLFLFVTELLSYFAEEREDRSANDKKKRGEVTDLLTKSKWIRLIKLTAFVYILYYLLINPLGGWHLFALFACAVFVGMHNALVSYVDKQKKKDAYE